MTTLAKNIDVFTKQKQENLSPEDALNLLKEGNIRFMTNNMIDRNLSHQKTETSIGQYPFASVLGCIDSRVPSELIFDQGIGDIFNARIAGNFVNDDIIGSLEFATAVAGSKLIVVLGHTHCGAVKGACDDVKMGKLTDTLKNIKPAVESVTYISENRSSENAEFVQKVSDSNVAINVDKLYHNSEVLKGLVDEGKLKIVGAMYDIETGEVKFF